MLLLHVQLYVAHNQNMTCNSRVHELFPYKYCRKKWQMQGVWGKQHLWRSKTSVKIFGKYALKARRLWENWASLFLDVIESFCETSCSVHKELWTGVQKWESDKCLVTSTMVEMQCKYLCESIRILNLSANAYAECVRMTADWGRGKGVAFSINRCIFIWTLNFVSELSFLRINLFPACHVLKQWQMQHVKKRHNCWMIVPHAWEGSTCLTDDQNRQ